MADDIIEVLEIGLSLHLVNSGMSKNEADNCLKCFFEKFRDSYGGASYFVKQGYRRYPPSLIRDIKSAYNGRNEKELCAAHGMSRTTFYRKIKK